MKRVNVAEFVNICDGVSSFEEAAEKLGVKPVTVQHRYYRVRKEYPGIFRSPLKSKNSTKIDVLAELASLRGITKDELLSEMEKNSSLNTK